MASSATITELTAPNGVKYQQPLGLFINNEFVSAKSGTYISSVNPADEVEIAKVHAAGAEDVNIAVQAARAALDGPWNGFTSTKRGRLLGHLADLVEAEAEVLGTIEAWDCGKPYRVTLVDDARETIAVFRYYAGYADKLRGQVIETEKNQHVFTTREPIGVCGQIIPWNYPLSMAAWKLGPAVATGNCVVIKAAEQTPLSILYLASLIKKAGYPKGVVNVINGYGREAGAALAGHMDVDKIAFTGSTETGREIMKLASANLKNITLETGGKSPLIVFEDAELEKAAYWGHIGIMSNAGQVCTANSRIFVHEKVYDNFMAHFLKQVNGAKIGNPFNQDTTQGPQVNKIQQERVLRYIELGISEGASLVTGGNVFGNPDEGKGYFIEPTVFTNVKDDMTIYREEIFGPVAAVMTFKTEEEVMRRANDTPFGLGAAIFTKDVSRIHRVTRRIQSGTVWVNSSNDSDIRAPFGGYKQSGIGRECGQAGIDAYTSVKTVFITLD
ncbi:aldehyde dehydrogenase (NAD+) [Fusarium mexicanum]|uniref:Aldehyde dehydrogenase (NAD+) n=1 Tax=Fusarium mexicanum TaxID=751941 RepID=A0A8H5JFX2_9HYPO|nr:aldehyde dehydrogenase (NAD+) [Fusarium mexicanum]